ncbi:hypothetical protein KIN20_028327 [Parelaphostrongylus tenuis]|uniref:Uncharacterized protein n=1 Tax=Parelaphostrongylus tenuis TaxID=148309 RepID=A0AAD5WEY4_PARTN|nr:hypothetical protein KIN20_028327 [Parelaphostrongylus tenuis]
MPISFISRQILSAYKVRSIRSITTSILYGQSSRIARTPLFVAQNVWSRFAWKLSENRSSQIEIRHRISFLSALQRLANLINNIPNSVSTLWLEKVSSCLVDISSYKEKIDRTEQRKQNSQTNRLKDHYEMLTSVFAGVNKVVGFTEITRI